MQKRKINKKTAIIAILLVFAMIISVFAINSTLQANKITGANTNISPYKYSMVVAYVGYWKSGDDYWADMNRKTGRVRVNMGKEPAQYVEWDYWFPAATIPGNYEIDSTMNLKDYKGSWEDLNYIGLSEYEVKKHYMDTAVIENDPDIKGAKNTTVQFQASFRPLNPDESGFSGTKFAKKEVDVYKCYIAIVIKYVDSDFVKDPDKWWRDHGGNPDDPGSGDITLEIEYRENTTTGRKLIDNKTININAGEIVNLNSYKVDDYICKGHFIMGQTTEYFYSTNASFTLGKENYSKPVDGKLKIIFIYEKIPYVSTPDTGVEINYNKDCWEIIPLDGQDINKIYFEKNLPNLSEDDNIIQLKYSSLNNTKLQFKESGEYKIRLQVTDTDGNVSDWTEELPLMKIYHLK